jgi:ATP-dependent Clp protease adaptor protein ClpS
MPPPVRGHLSIHTQLEGGGDRVAEGEPNRREPLSAPVALEEPDTGTTSGSQYGWRCILYNDEVHTFAEVIAQLMAALGCVRAQAEEISWTAHRRGRAICYQGTFDECNAVALVLKQIELRVEVSRD